MSKLINTQLPTGIWKIHIHNEEGNLDISSVGDQGQLTGTVFGDEITGTFNSTTGEIQFSRRIGKLADWENYTGWLSVIKNGVQPGSGTYLLAGFYQTSPFQTGKHGWYATAIIL